MSDLHDAFERSAGGHARPTEYLVSVVTLNSYICLNISLAVIPGYDHISVIHFRQNPGIRIIPCCLD
jgi:hypothetical protein